MVIRLKIVRELLAGVFFALIPALGFGQLIISEFMADNETVLQDENGDYSDWIEVYNTSGSTIDLGGWHLTDDTNDLSQWTFPSTNIAPDSFVTIFASGKNRAFAGQELHTSFGLDSKGEYLALVLPDGTNIVSEFRDAYPKQFGDISYGYQTHGAPHTLRAGEAGYLIRHTPGAANTNWPALHPVYADQSVGRIDMYLSQGHWEDLNDNQDWWDPEVNATLRYRHGDIDVTVSNVLVRQRGNTSFEKKPRSFHISFNTYNPGQDLFDIEKLNLNSEVNDPTSTRSKIINEMIHAADIPSAYANHIALVVHYTNGNNAVFFDALRNNIQPIDDALMEQQYGSSAANLYKCLYIGGDGPADLKYRGPTGSSYANVSSYDLKYQGGADASYDDFANFVDIINNTPSTDFPNEITQAFDVDDYLKRMAINVLSGSWDDHWFLWNNFYLFKDPIHGKWKLLTYDFDNTLGIDWVGDDWGTRDIYNFGSTDPNTSPLIGHIFEEPEFKNRYSFFMNEMLTSFYTSSGLTARAYAIRDTLTAPLPFGSPNVSNMKQLERNRYSGDDPYWTYGDFLDFYDNPIDHNVPDDYGVTPFFGARRTSALAQLNLTNIAPIISRFKVEPELPTIGDEIYFRAKVYDDVAVASVALWYSFDGGAYTNLTLGAAGGTWYEASLPAFTTNGVLTYYLAATDDTGAVTYDPYGGSNYAYSVDIDSSSLNLKITELNYHPHLPTGSELLVTIDEDQFEYIELKNTGALPLQLAGFEITDAIAYIFPSTILAPGAYALVVKNQLAYEARYGTTNIVVGEYSGKLSDGGEQVRLLDANGREIQVFTYSDGGSWPGRADGKGSTLEVIDTAGDYTSSTNWRSSSEYGGTPGYIGLGPDNRIVVNEVLTHTDPPLVDAIELFNTTPSAIDISGWFLSDNSDDYRKFHIPGGTVIAGESYMVFDETNDFNTSLGIASNDFAFSGAHGDDVWLMEADTSSNLFRFVDHVDFGAAKNGESFGRWPNGSGSLYPMISRTLGGSNSGPRVGPVVISEIMYHPTNEVADYEFVEIYNGSTQTVDLTNWRLRKGVDFDFATNHFVNAGETVVVLPFDPDDVANAVKLTAFLTYYGIDPSVDLVGPYGGALDAAGETIELQRPDDPPVEEPTFRPRLLEDEVKYDDAAPWPTQPDGTGPSLTRIHFSFWGNDPDSWRGDLPGSPGNFFISNAWLLSIVSDHGTPDPAVGNHIYDPDNIVTASVNAVEVLGLTRYVNTGWTLDGLDPSSGTNQSVTFTMTNNVTLSWSWDTNHYLSVTSSVGGSVNGTNGWYDRNSVVALDAIPDTSNVFAGWTGDLGAIVSGNATSESIGVVINGPVDLTAVFADGFHDLAVESVHGNPTPSTGLHVLPNGATVNASVESTIELGDSQLACQGWTLLGDINGAGSSNAVSFTLTGDQLLRWNWVTNGWLEVLADPGGTASGSGWQALGSTVELSASPAIGYGFFRWVGDTAAIVGGDEFSTNISVLMSMPLNLTAEFCLLKDSSNMMRNPSFETQGTTSEDAYYWEYGNPDVNGGMDGSAARVSWPTDGRPHGPGLWHATIQGTWAPGPDTQGQWWQTFPAHEGVTYTVSGWFWASIDWSAQTQVMFVMYLDESDAILDSVSLPLNGLGAFWSERTIVSTAPENTTKFYVSVLATNVGASGALQFDDFQVTSSTCLNSPDLNIELTPGTADVLSWESIGGAVYTLQLSTNLLSGFQDMTSDITSTPPLNVYTNPASGSGSAYYQLKLEAQ